MLDRRVSTVHLEMDFPEFRVGIVLMPSNQQRPYWLDPVYPVVVHTSASDSVEAHLDSGIFSRMRGFIEEDLRVDLRNDSVLSRGADTRPRKLYVLEPSVRFEPVDDSFPV